MKILSMVFIGSLFLLVSNANAQNNRYKVIDSETKAQLPKAKVLFRTGSDTASTKGKYTDEQGVFEINAEEKKSVKSFKVSYVGYRDTVIDVSSTSTGTYHFIEMKKSKNASEEVVIVGEKQNIEYTAGKKTINIDNSVVSNAGNTLDVLRTMPGITVDVDGNVSLRGTNTVNLMIDNKPIRLYGDPNKILQNLPASVLEKIEIITNPGAQYDAEGQAGIVNIVLKKKRQGDFNGSINSTIGNIDTYSLSSQFNSPLDNLNFFYGFDVTSARHKRITKVESNFYGVNNEENLRTERNGNQGTASLSTGIRAGGDLSVSTYDKITVSLDYRYSNSETIYSNRATTLFPSVDNSPISYFRSKSETSSPFNFATLGINYSHKSDNGAELTLDAFYFPTTFDQSSVLENVENDSLLVDINPMNNNNYKTRLFGNSHSYQVQADFRYPISEKVKWEFGLKGYLVGINSEFTFDRFDNVKQLYYKDVLQSTKAGHQDNVFASYANYSNSFVGIDFQLGLRSEMTTNKLYDFFQNGDDSSNFYRQFINVFPNCSFTYPISDFSSVQLSYSRRINRPDPPLLNPFLDKSDSLIWRSGNAQLLPEFVNSFELGYLTNFDIGSISSEVFLRHTTQLMNPRFREKVSDNIVLEKPRNIGTALNYGINVGGNLDITKFWKVNGDFSLFIQNTEGVDGVRQYREQSVGWIGKLISTLILPNDLIIQLYADYTSPVVITQGKRYAFNMMNLAVRKDFLDRKFSLAFNWIDFLNTARFGGVVEGDNFNTELLNQRDFTFMQVTLSYNINSNNDNRRKKNPDGGGILGGGNTI